MSNGPINGIEGLQEALALLEGLGQSLGPTSWIAGLEVRLRGTDGPQVRTVIEREGFGRETLDAALLIKRVSAQIDVLVHAIPSSPASYPTGSGPPSVPEREDEWRVGSRRRSAASPSSSSLWAWSPA